MDGTVIDVALPGCFSEQNAAYNGDRRKLALKVQSITSPYGLILHAAGPIEVREHDWPSYFRSGIEQQLYSVRTVDGTQYYVHAGSGKNGRSSVDVPFQETDFSHDANAASKSTAAVCVTVEWSYQGVKLY